MISLAVSEVNGHRRDWSREREFPAAACRQWYDRRSQPCCCLAVCRAAWSDRATTASFLPQSIQKTIENAVLTHVLFDAL